MSAFVDDFAETMVEVNNLPDDDATATGAEGASGASTRVMTVEDYEQAERARDVDRVLIELGFQLEPPAAEGSGGAPANFERLSTPEIFSTHVEHIGEPDWDSASQQPPEDMDWLDGTLATLAEPTSLEMPPPVAAPGMLTPPDSPETLPPHGTLATPAEPTFSGIMPGMNGPCGAPGASVPSMTPETPTIVDGLVPASAPLALPSYSTPGTYVLPISYGMASQQPLPPFPGLGSALAMPAPQTLARMPPAANEPGATPGTSAHQPPGGISAEVLLQCNPDLADGPQKHGRYQPKAKRGPHRSSPLRDITPVRSVAKASNREGMVKPKPDSDMSYTRAYNDHKRNCRESHGTCRHGCPLLNQYHEQWEKKVGQRSFPIDPNTGEKVKAAVNGLWLHNYQDRTRKSAWTKKPEEETEEAKKSQ